MVNLTRIYTRTGDAGTTRLSDNSVAAKTDPRVDAYGHVDELNAAIGVALATGGINDEVSQVLKLIQNELFDVGADISNPLAENPKWIPLRIEQESIDRLEQWCDYFGDPLPNLRSFILPGGNLAGSQLHVARTLARRAERAAWVAVEKYGSETATTEDEVGGVNLLAVKYLNRLSDLLFILCRVVNVDADAEVLWIAGSGRENPNLAK